MRRGVSPNGPDRPCLCDQVPAVSSVLQPQPWPSQASPPRPCLAWACAAAFPPWPAAPTPLVSAWEGAIGRAGPRGALRWETPGAEACSSLAGHGHAHNPYRVHVARRIARWGDSRQSAGLCRRRRRCRRRPQRAPLAAIPVPCSGGRPQVCQGPRVGEGGGRCGDRGHHRPRAGGCNRRTAAGVAACVCRPPCHKRLTALPACRASWAMWCTLRCPRWAPPSAPATAWPLWSRSRCGRDYEVRDWKLGFGLLRHRGCLPDGWTACAAYSCSDLPAWAPSILSSCLRPSCRLKAHSCPSVALPACAGRQRHHLARVWRDCGCQRGAVQRLIQGGCQRLTADLHTANTWCGSQARPLCSCRAGHMNLCCFAAHQLLGAAAL